jgi:hypothetical protein
MNEASVVCSQSKATIREPKEQSEREDRTARVPQSQASLLMETRQNDQCLENATQDMGFVPIASSPSMSNLVINNDALTGSTEVQLSASSSPATTPPASPIACKSVSPDSPLRGVSTHGCGSSNHAKSCQKRGRFLVWPVATPTCDSPSTTSTAS